MPTPAPTDTVVTDEAALLAWRDRFVHVGLGGYLDTASHAPQAVDHRHALDAYLESWTGGHAPWGHAWQELHDEVVARTEALLGAATGTIALVPSASHALLGVLSALPPEDGRDTLVIGEREWVSNRHAVAADGRYRVEVVPAGEPADGAGFLGRLDARTRLVVVSQVCFRTGANVDVTSVARRAHGVGACVFADVYQAAGAVPVELERSGVDFAGGGYLKHLLGAPGLAWCYARPGLAPGLTPRLTGWRGQRDPMNPTLDLAAGAQRFATGTWPVPSLYLARAGLDLIEAAGPVRIAAQVARLSSRFAQRCRTAGIEVVTAAASAERGPIVVVRVPEANAVAARLAARGIALTARDGTLRASFHAHLRVADVDAACDALIDAVAKES